MIESTYYLQHYSGVREYQQMGEIMFNDFVKYCRTDTGYAALQNVITKRESDEMESFLFAKTFKYFYLLFAPQAVDFGRHITFNTEVICYAALVNPAGRKSRDYADDLDDRVIGRKERKRSGSDFASSATGARATRQRAGLTRGPGDRSLVQTPQCSECRVNLGGFRNRRARRPFRSTSHGSSS